jgi:hypothetical protein
MTKYKPSEGDVVHLLEEAKTLHSQSGSLFLSNEEKASLKRMVKQLLEQAASCISGD